MYIEKLTYQEMVELHKATFGDKIKDAVYTAVTWGNKNSVIVTAPDGYEEEFQYTDFNAPKGCHRTMYWESINFFEWMAKRFGDEYIREYSNSRQVFKK